MSNEMTTSEYTGQSSVSVNDVQLDTTNVNKGTAIVEMSRAVAETKGKLEMAKMFPRDETAAYTKIIENCRRPEFASKAFYNFPRSGGSVEGVTIRFAETMARCWGNLDYGIKELSQENGRSEMQAFCWDMETNTISSQNFTNIHARDVKGKVVELTSLRDVYEINANMAQRRLRARILAVIPNWITEAAIAECKKTIAGDNSIPLKDKINKMAVSFKESFGVDTEALEKKQKKPIKNFNNDDLVELIGVYNSLKEKSSTVADWFEYDKAEKTDLGSQLE